MRPPRKYRKKPVVIDAVLYVGSGDVDPRLEGRLPEWLWEAFENEVLVPTNGTDPLVCHTLEGPLTVGPGDWIIRGIKGELYPCKPDVFEASYEPAEDADGNEIAPSIA